MLELVLMGVRVEEVWVSLTVVVVDETAVEVEEVSVLVAEVVLGLALDVVVEVSGGAPW